MVKVAFLGSMGSWRLATEVVDVLLRVLVDGRRHFAGQSGEVCSIVQIGYNWHTLAGVCAYLVLTGGP